MPANKTRRTCEWEAIACKVNVVALAHAGFES